MKDLQQRTLRGGLAKLCAQGLNFTLRIGSLMILGRLLDPNDFGLVGMVTAMIGVFNLFRDFGLSTAAVQRPNVTKEQHSTLFWVNMLAGAILTVLVMASAPAIASFYHEPRLLAVTSVLALGFIFNAAGVQHDALLQRQLRFTTTATVDIIALFCSVTAGVGMALRGYGYWSLVAMTIVPPLVSSCCYWIATGWIPGRPHRGVGVLSMLRFGGTLTLNGLIVYVAYNLEKVLLGRYWGAMAIGLYGRAYQLVNIPTENLNSAAGGVAFPALSRLQNEPDRFRSYFLKGYSLVLALTIPITVVCALFAEELIQVLLGPKWQGTGEVFRLLAPTIMIFALINPLAWVMFSLGMVGRSLKVAAVLAPVVIAGYIMGLPHGPRGVAVGYSAVMAAWAFPHIAWCIRGTPISLRDVFVTFQKPLVSAILAGILPLLLKVFAGQAFSPLAHLLLGGPLFLSGYVAMLFLVMGQKAFYLGLLRAFRGRTVVAEEAMASA
jgi:PST family polysaccharide transporter